MSLRVMIYSPSDFGRDLWRTFDKKTYKTFKLTKDEQAFWDALETVDKNGYFFLFSHGDNKGPLLVDGQYGKDMTDDTAARLAKKISDNKISFYVISCSTGQSNLAKELTKLGCQFLAPNGKAAVKCHFDTNRLTIASESGGWAGPIPLGTVRRSTDEVVNVP